MNAFKGEKVTCSSNLLKCYTYWKTTKAFQTKLLRTVISWLPQHKCQVNQVAVVENQEYSEWQKVRLKDKLKSSSTADSCFFSTINFLNSRNLTQRISLCNVELAGMLRPCALLSISFKLSISSYSCMPQFHNAQFLEC